MDLCDDTLDALLTAALRASKCKKCAGTGRESYERLARSGTYYVWDSMICSVCPGDGVICQDDMVASDTAILSIIADRLEGADDNEPHPAAAWWRQQIGTHTTLIRTGELRRATGNTAIFLRDVTESVFPGAKDLMRRIDGIRLHNILKM